MKLLYSVLITSIIVLSVNGSEYEVFTPKSYISGFSQNTHEERILFILDLSNSMNGALENSTKFNLMLRTMKEILPKISNSTWVGLRVYGQKMGFTPIEACRATSLIAPISPNNTNNIENALQKRKPRGMTPITYSLKQAIKYDFLGYPGEKHIILMTDGGENCDESPCKYAMELIKIRRDVKIDVIAFNIDDEDDLKQLQCTARRHWGAGVCSPHAERSEQRNCLTGKICLSHIRESGEDI